MTSITKKSNTNILYVIHGYPPLQHAGTENYSYALAKEIANHRFNVAAFYPIFSPNIDQTKIETKKIANHIAFEIKTKNCNILNNLYNEDIELHFLNTVKNFRPDIIHFQHTHALLPFSLLLHSIQMNVPTVITLHDFWYICPKTYMINIDGSLCSGPSSPGKCAKCFLENESMELKDIEKLLQYTTDLFSKRMDISRLIFSNANLTTAPSKFLLDKYKKFISFRQDLRMPLGLEIPRHPQQKIHCNSTRFGFLGNIAPLKNVHGLIESFSRTTGDAELHIYGKMNDGSLSNALTYLASKDTRITLHGRYSPDDLGKILSQIDVGIVPSFFENYPLVVREFLSTGIPVIASRTGGIPEIVSHNNNGLLFDPLKSEELQHSIQEIINNPFLIKKFATNITKPKTMTQDAAVWSDIYQSL